MIFKSDGKSLGKWIDRGLQVFRRQDLQDKIGEAEDRVTPFPPEAAEPAHAFPTPTFTHPVSQLVTAEQFLEPAFKQWACREMGWQFGFNRKLWEYAFILNAVARACSQ